tara:strand:+ start:136 stop:606 length:471 start_codon:yes stop_codon:yes gene_type:complete
LYSDEGDAQRCSFLKPEEFAKLRDGSRAWHLRQDVLAARTVGDFCKALTRHSSCTVTLASDSVCSMQQAMRMCEDNEIENDVISFLESKRFGVSFTDGGSAAASSAEARVSAGMLFIKEAKAWWLMMKPDTPSLMSQSSPVDGDGGPPLLALDAAK